MNLTPTSPYSVAQQPQLSQQPQQQQPPQQQYASYSPQAQTRASPTRNNPYLSQSYFSSPPGKLLLDSECGIPMLIQITASRPNAPQLPPIQSNMNPSAYHPQSAPLTLSPFSRDMSSAGASPRQPQPQQLAPVTKGPVPKFTKCLSVSELKPRINDQPPFRRANPEGGFISVCVNSFSLPN
jgi:dual specificity protein kinase YAK1